MKHTYHPTTRAMFSLLLVSSLLFSGCWSFYQRQTINQEEHLSDPWIKKVQQIKEVRPVIQVHTNDGVKDLENYRFEDDKIIGTLKPSKTVFNVPDKRTFTRKYVPSEQRNIFFLTMHLHPTTAIGGDSEKEVELLAKDIAMIRYYTKDHALTFLTHTLVGAAEVGIFLAIACNCPRVYAVDDSGKKEIMGSLFTGAISKSLERSDLLPLPALQANGNTLTLSVDNELPEEEFIDELVLLKTQKKVHTQIATDIEGNLFEYNPDLIRPTEATSLDGRAILSQVENPDMLFHDFDDQVDKKELNSAIFKFNKKEVKNNTVKLVILGQQSKLLEASSEYVFRLFGTSYDKMTKKLDKRPLERYERGLSEKGVAMNAYLRTEKGWDKLGSFTYASIIGQKWLGMNVDLNRIQGENIEIKLESAYKFWELDYLGLSNDWNPLSNYEEVPLISATNEKGEDVASIIQMADQDYAIQPNKGSHIRLTFENNAKENEFYVLKGTGFYRHIRDYTHKPQKRMLLKVKSLGPMAGQEISKSLDAYFQAVSMDQTERK